MMFLMCLEGRGGQRTLEHAIYWLHRSYHQGYVPAYNSLGYCYMFGYGVEVDQDKAVKLFEKGAERGHRDAQHHLSVCYEEGMGVVSNKTKAAYWKQQYEGNSGPVITGDHDSLDLKAVIELAPISVRKCENPVEVMARLSLQHIAMSYLVGFPLYLKDANLALSFFVEAEKRIPRPLMEFAKKIYLS